MVSVSPRPCQHLFPLWVFYCIWGWGWELIFFLIIAIPVGVRWSVIFLKAILQHFTPLLKTLPTCFNALRATLQHLETLQCYIVIWPQSTSSPSHTPTSFVFSPQGTLIFSWLTDQVLLPPPVSQLLNILFPLS